MHRPVAGELVGASAVSGADGRDGVAFPINNDESADGFLVSKQQVIRVESIKVSEYGALPSLSANTPQQPIDSTVNRI
jgi:hypothetical protein